MVRFTELSENLMKTMMDRSILPNSRKWSDQSKMEVLMIMTQMRKKKGSSKIQKIYKITELINKVKVLKNKIIKLLLKLPEKSSKMLWVPN